MQYLDESLDAWVGLRSELPVTDFLNDILSDTLPVTKYFSRRDHAYFEKLKELYAETESGYSSAVKQICSKLASVDLKDTSATAEIVPTPAQPTHNSHRRIPM